MDYGVVSQLESEKLKSVQKSFLMANSKLLRE